MTDRDSQDHPDAEIQSVRQSPDSYATAVEEGSVLNAAAPHAPAAGRHWLTRVIQGAESLLSAVSFISMFLVIVLGVFFRYFLNAPLTWTVAVASSWFIWTTMITAGLPHWDDEHIQFDLVYLKLGNAGQRWARIVGNLIIIVPALLVIPASFQYLDFLRPQKLSGLDVSLTWAFAGIAYFYVTTVLHRGRLLIKDVADLYRSLRGRAEVSS